ncbi:MarR family transcriptional regulator [Corynebacterium sp. 13CS0277]|uniref:MarR family winged helix-turn-helix transcriptional regulator n=1 Tax=Corynebacterium sp. 13CS0277 TaxID=2071994 RepID=UPI000D046C49|nr:MarR family transcriptional regulator [Corynebacterium sp. 13CS0277]PRQ12081.1 MarR family transcriptional regulator [Corynebacterium sp. 13CS0277]
MTTPVWLSDDEQDFWRLLLEAHNALFRGVEEQLQTDSQLGHSEYAVLVGLSEAPNHQLRMREISSHLDWDRSRCSHLIRRMEKRGLVAKSPCDNDGRGIVVTLTPEGLSRIQAAAPGHVDTVRRLVFDHLNEQDPAIQDAVKEFHRTIVAQQRQLAEQLQQENSTETTS